VRITLHVELGGLESWKEKAKGADGWVALVDTTTLLIVLMKFRVLQQAVRKPTEEARTVAKSIPSPAELSV